MIDLLQLWEDRGGWPRSTGHTGQEMSQKNVLTSDTMMHVSLVYKGPRGTQVYVNVASLNIQLFN